MSRISTPNDEWISDVSVPDPEGLRPMGWQVVVRPMAIRAKTKGGIILPDKFKDDVNYLTTVGKVLAIGPLAFTSDDLMLPRFDEEGRLVDKVYSPWYQVGDFVTYGKYAGARRAFKGVKLLFLKEMEILDVIENPHDIDPMFELGGGLSYD